LDGRSLVVPENGGDEDMSSLGTSRFGGYNYGNGTTIGYVGNMRIVGRAEDYDYDDGAPLPPHRSPMTPSHLETGEYDFQTNDYSVHTEEKIAAQTLGEKDEINEKEAHKSGCLPAWITGAPYWLKLVIIFSTALLVGAVILIAVGASLAFNKSSSSNNADQSPSTTAPTKVAGTTVAPTIAPSKAGNEITAPENNLEDFSTLPPTIAPVQATVWPVTEPSFNSTWSESKVNFFLLGGRFDGEALTDLTNSLATLPNIDGNTVLFHLGDWNSPYATSCVESSYALNAEVYQQSSIPVYFVPGDNEFNGKQISTESSYSLNFRNGWHTDACLFFSNFKLLCIYRLPKPNTGIRILVPVYPRV
jgi:hypothetical protein